MYNNHPTPVSDLNGILHELAAGAQAVLGDLFTGAYLHGSFAVGDWDLHSDVDFLIVTEQDVPDSLLPALQALHGRIYDLDSPWAKHLEGSYFPKQILKQPDPEKIPLLYLDNTSRELIRSTHDNTLVVRWVVRERGIALAGPPPETLIDTVDPNLLRREVLTTMQDWAQQIFADPEQMNNRWYQPYAVLSYCRMLYTLQTGRIESKLKGAEWAKLNLNPRWIGLVEQAWSQRPDPSLKVRQKADPADLEKTLEFIRDALQGGAGMLENSTAHLSLAATARWTASARAHESEREDRLFHDPWAAALAGEAGAAWLAKQAASPMGIAPMIIRTRYFDDFLVDAVQQHSIRQVVILAAGLDTRAFRLDWPAGTRLFELDQEPVLDYKELVLQAEDAQPTCERHTVPGDLATSWQAGLIDTGFDPLQPSAWLLEGFLFYLPNERIVQILDQVSGLAAPGSRLGFDTINSATLTSPITKSWIDMQAQQGAPWLGALDDPETFLAERGWKASLTQPGAPDAHFGRWTLPVIPVKMPGMPHNWYVTASME